MFPNHHYAGAPRQLRRRYRGWQRPARVALNSQTRIRQPRNSQQDKKTVNENVKELLTRIYARQFCLLNACARRPLLPDTGSGYGRVIGTGPRRQRSHPRRRGLGHGRTDGVTVLVRRATRHCSRSEHVHHGPFSERQDFLTKRSVRYRLPTREAQGASMVRQDVRFGLPTGKEPTQGGRAAHVTGQLGRLRRDTKDRSHRPACALRTPAGSTWPRPRGTRR